MRWISVCGRAELEAAGKLERSAAGVGVLLIWRSLGASPWACAALCPHAFSPLIAGEVKGGRLRCGRHLASFDLETGEPDPGWRIAALKIYPTRLTGDVVEIGLPD